jgi:hypothetical protein
VLVRRIETTSRPTPRPTPSFSTTTRARLPDSRFGYAGAAYDADVAYDADDAYDAGTTVKYVVVREQYQTKILVPCAQLPVGWTQYEQEGASTISFTPASLHLYRIHVYQTFVTIELWPRRWSSA